MATANYFVPPIVESWPIFLMYYLGTANIIHFVVLLAMFWAVRGKSTIFAKDEEHDVAPKETDAA